MAVTNPNGANQFLLDPRQKLFWEKYSNPKSETFGNITQSGLSVGYTEGYSDEIGQSDWFREKLWKLNSVFSSERKMKELLELDLNNGGDKVDVGIARIQADLVKFLASTLGKEEGYSSRTEHTGANGADLPTPILTIAKE